MVILCPPLPQVANQGQDYQSELVCSQEEQVVLVRVNSQFSLVTGAPQGKVASGTQSSEQGRPHAQRELRFGQEFRTGFQESGCNDLGAGIVT